MGYENGKIYWIVPQNNTGIALSVYGNTQVSQNRNVIVWSKQDVLDQLWRVDIDNGFARIKSAINYDYALNIWLGLLTMVTVISILGATIRMILKLILRRLMQAETSI